MSLLAHLILADVRRHRWLLCSWIAAIAASTVVEGVRPSFVSQPTAETIALLDALLFIVRQLLRVVLVALIVQTHPLVGSDAFWLTRPIPRMTLLTAKAIVLAVVVVLVPVAAESVLEAMYGVLPGEIVRVAVESALFAAMWAALLAVAAALTPTFARFVLLCSGLLATLVLYVAGQATIRSIWPPPRPTIADLPGPADSTGTVIVVLMLTLACVATLVAHYAARRLARSGLVAVVAVIGALSITDFWPWRFLRANVDYPTWAAREASLPLAANTGALRSSYEGALSQGQPPGRNVSTFIEASGLEPEWSGTVGLLQATLQLDGGSTLTSYASPFGFPLRTSDAKLSSDEAIRHLLGASELTTANPAPSSASPLLVLRDSEFSRFAPAGGQYRGRFHLQLKHHQIQASLTVSPGMEARHRSYRVVVDSSLPSPRGVLVRLRESDATSSFDRRPRIDRTYYLRNRRTGQAVEGQPVFSDVGVVPRLIDSLALSSSRPIWGFRTAGIALAFPPAWVTLHSAPPDETWLTDGDLVIVRSTREAGMERTLEIDGFPLAVTPPER